MATEEDDEEEQEEEEDHKSVVSWHPREESDDLTVWNAAGRSRNMKTEKLPVE